MVSDITGGGGGVYLGVVTTSHGVYSECIPCELIESVGGGTSHPRLGRSRVDSLNISIWGLFM